MRPGSIEVPGPCFVVGHDIDKIVQLQCALLIRSAFQLANAAVINFFFGFKAAESSLTKGA